MGFLGNQFRFGGQTNLTLSGSTRTLTEEEAFHRLIVFDSTTTNCTVTVPNLPGADWVFKNSAADSVTLQTTTGGTIALPAGATVVVYCDGDTGLVSPLTSPTRIGYVKPSIGYFTTAIAGALQVYTTPSDPANDAAADLYSVAATVTGTSTNATPFTLTTYSPNATSGANGVIQFVGGCRNTATGEVHLFDVKTSFKLVSGTASVYGDVASGLYDAVGGVDIGAIDAALATAAIGFDVSSGNVLVRATGVAATTLKWWGRVTVWSATVA